MRQSTMVAAVALAMLAFGTHTVLAQNAPPASQREIAELRAQVTALMARIDDLEARDDAQSVINIDTAQAISARAMTQPKVETKGGLKVTSSDGAFEFSVGGRLHFDGYAFDEDRVNATGTTEFRRARLTLAGKAWGWEYKMEQDFAAGSNLDGLRDVYIAKQFGLGKLTIGHFKPYRSMEELTSSNDLLVMERPFASATGLFSGRQLQQGVGYQVSGLNYSIGATAFNLRSAASPRTEGLGASARATWAPIMSGSRTLHLGGWLSHENANEGSANLTAVANYAGRRGPGQTIATTTGASGDQVNAYGLELAGQYGPLFFQSEFVSAVFNQPLGPDQDVQTYYVQGSWMLNGGQKVYKPGTGVFGSPKVADVGLWELTARYDHIGNADVANREAASMILGLNYYLNPNLRLMLNYTQGENEVTGDDTAQYAVRTQFNF